MDVLTKEGSLLLQGVKFGKKIWRKTWFMVYEASAIGIGRIELYDMRDGWGLLGSGTSRPAGLKKMEKRVIRLSDCLSITPAPGESCPTSFSAFFLNTLTCTYTIASPIHEDWMSVLCRLAFQKSGDEHAGKHQRDKCTENELYSTWGVGQFQVTVKRTDLSQKCRMSGSYLLSVEKEAIALLDLKTGQTINHWPYRLLRKFGQVKGGIMLEAGRRCHTGEGHLFFLSNQGSQIHRAIEEAIMHQSVQDLLAEATSQPREFASQSPDSKTQDKSRVKKTPPVKVNKDRPCPPVQRKPGQQIHKAIAQVLMHHNAPDLPRQQASLPLPPSPKPPNREMAKSSPPPPPVPTARPRVTVPRRNFSSPDLPNIKSPPSSPDDALYTSILPRSRMNLLRDPIPPDVSMDKNLLKDPSENQDEDNTYINWMGKTTAEQDKPTAEVIYSTVNFKAKSKNNQRKDTDVQDQPNIGQQSHVHSSVSREIPDDFKQTLSNILFKDLSKISPSVLPRSHGGSSNHLERTDD